MDSLSPRPTSAPSPSHAPSHALPARGAWASVKALAGDIKLAHSVFAMPFAVLGAVLAGPFPGGDATSARRFAGQVALVVVCMVLARSWAMLVNRLADRTFDAANPRTARRALASGRVDARRGWLAACACAAGFVVATAGFWLFFENRWPMILSVPTLGLLALYSYTKRFTALCHVVLGVCLAFSPIAAAIAIRPAYLHEVATLWWLAGFVACWVAGFDVIYALQDMGFDRARGLSSIPAKLGPRGGVWVSRSLHLLALAFLVMAWHSQPSFGPIMAVGVVLAGVLLAWEHAVVARWLASPEVAGPRGAHDDPPPALQMAFFTLNGVVSCVLGFLGVLDHLLGNLPK